MLAFSAIQVAVDCLHLIPLGDGHGDELSNFELSSSDSDQLASASLELQEELVRYDIGYLETTLQGGLITVANKGFERVVD